jgi:hypothetical protein
MSLWEGGGDSGRRLTSKHPSSKLGGGMYCMDSYGLRVIQKGVRFRTTSRDELLG